MFPFILQLESQVYRYINQYDEESAIFLCISPVPLHSVRQHGQTALKHVVMSKRQSAQGLDNTCTITLEYGKYKIRKKFSSIFASTVEVHSFN